ESPPLKDARVDLPLVAGKLVMPRCLLGHLDRHGIAALAELTGRDVRGLLLARQAGISEDVERERSCCQREGEYDCAAAEEYGAADDAPAAPAPARGEQEEQGEGPADEHDCACD